MVELMEKLEKQKLYELMDQILVNSNFIIKKKKINSDNVEYLVDDGVRKFIINMIFKNLSKCGWEHKPEIKRIQVTNLSRNLVYTNKNRTFMICGFAKYNEKIILIVWNAYRYVNHITNRSCYVKDDSIIACYNKGYIISYDFEQETWLCDENNFRLLVRDYINFNYVGEKYDN